MFGIRAPTVLNFFSAKKLVCPGQTVVVAGTETGNFKILQAVEAKWTQPQPSTTSPKQKWTKHRRTKISSGTSKKRGRPRKNSDFTTTTATTKSTCKNKLEPPKLIAIVPKIVKKIPLHLSGPLLQSLKKVHLFYLH